MEPKRAILWLLRANRCKLGLALVDISIRNCLVAPTQKGIEFTEHAEAQMAARVISRDQVINAIRRPTSRGVGNADYTQRFEREFPPSRRLVVIAEELPDKFKVVTAYWQPLKK